MLTGGTDRNTCEICGLRLPTLRAIRDHAKTHINDKTLCKFCNRIVRDLKRHNRKVHRFTETKANLCMQ